MFAQKIRTVDVEGKTVKLQIVIGLLNACTSNIISFPSTFVSGYVWLLIFFLFVFLYIQSINCNMQSGQILLVAPDG
jgi:hypothetical protein